MTPMTTKRLTQTSSFFQDSLFLSLDENLNKIGVNSFDTEDFQSLGTRFLGNRWSLENTSNTSPI